MPSTPFQETAGTDAGLVPRAVYRTRRLATLGSDLVRDELRKLLTCRTQGESLPGTSALLFSGAPSLKQHVTAASTAGLIGSH